MKSKLGIEKQKKIIRELEAEGLREHCYEDIFWTEAARKRMEQPKELKHIVWYCLEMIKYALSKTDDPKGRILYCSFQEACEKYPQIHRLWYEEIIEIWVSKKSKSIPYQERVKFDTFFIDILEKNMPISYMSKDFISFVVAESNKENLLYFLQVYRQLWKEKLTLCLRRQKDRALYEKIFREIEEEDTKDKNRYKHKLLDCIGQVVWPVECKKDLVHTGAKSLGYCHDVVLFEKVRDCGLINEREIDVYLEELIYNASDLMVPFFIRIKFNRERK